MWSTNELIDQIKEHEDEYMIKKNVKLFCGTYNLNGQIVNESLEPWFCLHQPADIYVVGFQELCELSTASLLLNNDWNDRERYLQDYIEKYSNFMKKKKLVLKEKIRLWGIILFLYVSEEMNKDITSVTTSSVATGILNTLGNKGSVGISIELYDQRLCFICSHFASDPNQLERRNADFRYTMENLLFKLNSIDDENQIDIDTHQMIFWLGDFNYRLEYLTFEEAESYILDANFDHLLMFDQLTKQRTGTRAFADFQEGKIKFRPTYKYKIGTDNYDVIKNQNDQLTLAGSGSTSTKVKLPSWTDRIMWKAHDNSNISLSQYSCIQTLTISDHKPVYGLFDLEFKVRDDRKYKLFCEKMIKENDRLQNEQRPRISLVSSPELNFGQIDYYRPKMMEIKVKNEGISFVAIETSLHFVDNNLLKDRDAIFFRDQHFGTSPNRSPSFNLNNKYLQWFKIKPNKRTAIAPGSVVSLAISIDFNEFNLYRLNRQLHIDDIVVVKCIDGNDLFSNIVCDYTPSIIGVSLKALSTLDAHQSISECDREKLNEIENDINKHDIQIDRAFKSLIILHNEQRNINQKLFNNNPKSTFYDRTRATNAVANDGTFYGKILEESKQFIEKDKYFNGSLSIEYEKFMKYLIRKCNSTASRSSSNDILNEKIEIPIEEQKYSILKYLTERNFESLELTDFDFEILVEVLCDLLRCLPQALIPNRYYELCVNSMFNYEDATLILSCIPKSHQRLFELLIRFLKLYVKKDDINFNIIGDAVFQTSHFTDVQLPNKDTNSITSGAGMFLKSFVACYNS